MTNPSETAIRIIWTVFFAFWFYSATKIKQAKSSEPSWTRALHLAAMITNWVLLLSDGLPDLLLTRVIPPGLPNGNIGIFVAFAGLCLAIWARVSLGANWSGAVTLKTGHEIVKTGPYRCVRHPIYSGILTLVAGSAIAIGELRGAIAFLIVLVAYLIKIPREEKLLSTHFPDVYPRYRSHSKKLIPFVF